MAASSNGSQSILDTLLTDWFLKNLISPAQIHQKSTGRFRELLEEAAVGFSDPIPSDLDKLIECLEFNKNLTHRLTQMTILKIKRKLALAVMLCADDAAQLNFRLHTLRPYMLNRERFAKKKDTLKQLLGVTELPNDMESLWYEFILPGVTRNEETTTHGNAHEVAHSSASAAIDSHGESSNTSVTTDADLSEKRHRVNSSTASAATVDASETLPEKLFSSLILRHLLSPNTIQVTEKEMIPDKIDDLHNAMGDSGRFKDVLDDFCNLFKSTGGADLAYKAKRLLSMIACLCIDDEANRNYIRGTLTEYVSDGEMKKRVVHMLSLTDDEKRQLESLLLTIVGVLDPVKATCEDEITLEDWIKRENFLSYIFPKSTDITAARQAIKDALHAGPNFDSKLVYSVISSCSEQDKVHVLRKVRYLVKICCKVTFRDAFQKRCLLKYASEHISEIVEVPSDHEEVEFVEDLLKRLVNEEVRLYRLSEEYHADVFIGQDELLRNVKRLLWTRRGILAEEPSEFQLIPSFRVPESSTESILLDNCFIDKSAAYKKVHESGVGIGLACFPRRFGKTTMLRFFSELCGLRPGDQKNVEEVYRRAMALEEGKYFLEQPIQPALYLSWSDEHSDPMAQLSAAIHRYLPGLRVRRDIDTNIRHIFRALYELFDEFIIPFLPIELKDNINPKLSLLIDEIQAPHIAIVSAEHDSNNEKLSQAKNTRDKIENFYRVIKEFYSTYFSRVFLSGILRVSGSGLSNLQMQDFATNAHYQDMVGITNAELRRSMQHLVVKGKPMSEGEAISHILDATEVISDPKKLTPEKKLEIFYDWLKCTCNGFCFAFAAKTDHDRQDLYSPLDVIARLETLYGKSCEPYSQWLENSRSCFASLMDAIAKHDRSRILECLCGGTIPRTSLYQRLEAHKYFANTSAALLRLYFELGVLRINSVTNSCATLTPSITTDTLNLHDAVFGELPENTWMSEEDAKKLCNDPKSFMEVIFECIQNSSKSMQTLFDCDYIREYDLQRMCFMKLMQRFSGNFGTVAIEQTFKSRERMDIYVKIFSKRKEIYAFDRDKCRQIVIECKLCRHEEDVAKLESTLRAQLEKEYAQATRYKESLPDDTIILAVAWGWTRQKLRMLTKCSLKYPNDSSNEYSVTFVREPKKK